MNEIMTIATVVISGDETNNDYTITGFHSIMTNLHAFNEEIKSMGGIMDKSCTEITIKNIPLKRISSCINAYFGKGATMSPGQRKWKDKLMNDVLNDDCFMKKDKDGIFIVDPYQLSGSINEIKKELMNEGIKVKKVVNRKRIYVEFPSSTILEPSNNKKKITKKKITKNNKNLENGDIIKYLGIPFEGFSKFNPKAKFVKYHEDNNKMVTINYKKEDVVVKINDITKI